MNPSAGMKKILKMIKLMANYRRTPELVSYRLGKKRNQLCPCGRHKTVTRPVVYSKFQSFRQDVIMETVSVPVKYKKCCWNSDNAVAV